MIVETGSGVQDADSYVALQDAYNFHLARENGAWLELGDSEGEAALIKATDYIEVRYKAIGRSLTHTQGLQFPVYRYGVPSVVKRAVMILALESLTNDLNPRINRDVKRLESRLEGVGLTDTFYDDDPVVDHYPFISAMLKAVARRRGAGVQCGRVTRPGEFDPFAYDELGAFPVLDGSGGGIVRFSANDDGCDLT